MADLNLADTFLNIARSARHADIRKRNIANAWKAHDAVVRLAPRVGLADSELIAITKKLQDLRVRIGEIEAQDSR